jgi:hypothetical protein
MDDDQDPPNPGPDFPAMKLAQSRDAAFEYLTTYASAIWPNTSPEDDRAAFRWDYLVAAPNLSGRERFDAQFFRANINASDRYVLSTPGDIHYRLYAWESGFDGLYLAGDWTCNGVDAGCVESAAISGRQAGRALLRETTALLGELAEVRQAYLDWLARHPAALTTIT